MNTLKKDLPILGIMLIPFLYLAYIWNKLPEKVPIHWNASGEIDGYGSKIELAIIPLLLPLFTYLLFLVIPKLDPKKNIEKMGNKFQSIKLTLTLFMSVLALYILYSSYNAESSSTSYIFLIVGAMLAALGNYMKTMKPNYFMGIRTPWTLENEKVWKDTHELGGKMWFIGGLIIVLANLIFSFKISFIICMSIVAIIAIIPIVYSYSQFKKYTATSILLIMFLCNSISYAQKERPQDPLPPFPYNVEEVSFKSTASDTIILAGTLTTPKEGSGFPVAILINGSGAMNRDSEVFGHKPFLVIADHLSKSGVAVLRFDERGVGKSTGSYSGATSYDLAKDVLGGINYVKTRPKLNPTKIGLVGHSEGGMIAQIVSAENEDISFLVSLAGAGIKGSEVMLTQNECIIKKMGFTDSLAAEQKTILKEAYQLIDDTSISDEELKTQLTKTFSKGPKALYPEAQIPLLVNDLASNWYKEFIRYDPTENLSKITCPVFILNGTEDVQILCDENVNGFFMGLENVSPLDFKAKKYKGLNHFFQTCDSCTHFEYGSLEETIAPVVLDDIRDWILKVTK